MAEADALVQLEEWVAPLLTAMAPGERRRLARQLGTDLRRSQQRRIARQENPDGSAFAPRKAPALRGKKGAIKRQAMFSKIRQAKHLKVTTTQDAVGVGFLGRVARIARVHQEGGAERVARGGPVVRYERRKLLGFSAGDLELVERRLLEHFAAV